MFDAIGGEADIGRASRSCRSGAIDPTRTSVNLTAYVAPANPAGNGSLGRSVSLLGWADMRRREFLGALGGLTAAWPLAARAQQPIMPVIGFLNSTSLDGYRPMLNAFRQGLQESGYIEGRNVAIEYRWAEGRNDRLPAMAAELGGRQVTVIAAPTTAAVLAGRPAPATSPIVFYPGGAPAQLALVTSLSRPGGNLAGVFSLSVERAARRLELLHELVPAASII